MSNEARARKLLKELGLEPHETFADDCNRHYHDLARVDIITAALDAARLEGAREMRESAAASCMAGATWLRECCLREASENARIIRVLKLGGDERKEGG